MRRRSGRGHPREGRRGVLSDFLSNKGHLFDELFEQDFPRLELVETFPLSNYLRYLLSGGLNFRELVPTFTEPALRALEQPLRPARRLLGLHHLIVLRRRA